MRRACTSPPLLAFISWLLVATLGGQIARADDWDIHRSEFDPRIVSRYKAMLNRSPNDGYALGKLISLYKKHRTLAALVTEYRALAKANPRAFAYQVILGHLYRRSGSIDQAVKHYEAAGELNSKSPTVPGALGTLYQKLGKSKEAAEAYKKALALSTSAKEKKHHLRSLASIALADRDLAAARKYYDQLVALEPRNIFLRIELAQALAKNGNDKEAIEQFETILKRTADSSTKADILKEIGGLQAKMGKEMEAVATYRKAMGLTAQGHWLRKELTDRIIAIYRGKEDLKGLIAFYEKTWQRKTYFEHEVLGRLYDETGDEAKALKSYQAAIKAQPQALDTRVRLISLLERSGHDKEVIAEYRKLAAIAPGDPKYQLELAKRLYRTGQQKEAFKVLDACASRFPSDASVHAALADLYARWGDQKRAMKSAQVLVRIEPKDPSHLINLGEQLFLQGQKRKAIETWKRMLLTIPQKHVGLSRLAEIYAQHEMVDEAIDLYRKAIKISPKTIPYRRELALLFERKQRTSDAIKTWDEVLQLAVAAGKADTKREARSHVIDILHRTYQLRQRLTSYRFAFDGPTPDLEAGFFLAEGHLKMGESEQAAQVYRRVLELKHDNLEALVALEALYRRQRKLANAVDLLKRLAVLQPRSAREYYQRIADLLLQLYRDKEALAYAHKAVAMGTQDASSYQRLGELYEKKEDYAGAMKAYAKSIQIDPNRIKVHFSLARLHTLQGRYAEAEKLYRKVIGVAKTPETVAKAFNLAIDICVHLGTLETLEKEMLPLTVTSANADVYRKLLVQLYRRRIPLLIDQARLGAATTRDRAQKELRQIGVRGLAPLLEELAATSAPPRKLIRMIGYLGNPNAVVPLLRIAEKEPEEQVTTIFGSPSAYGYGPYYSGYGYSKLAAMINRRVEATVAVGRIADERALSGLIGLLGSKEGALREAAAWSLGRIKSDKAGKALFNALGDSRSTVQIMACVGLGMQGNAEMRPILEEVMLDGERNERVRAACAWGLGALGSSKGVDQLIEVLQSGDDELQRCAAWSLGALADRKAIGPLVRAIWSKRNRVRQGVLWALLQISAGAKTRAHFAPDVVVKDGRLDDEEFLKRVTVEVDDLQGSALAKNVAGAIQVQQAAIAEGLQAALGRHRDIVLRVLGDLDSNPQRLSLGPLTAGRELLDAAARTQLDRNVDALGARIAPHVAKLLAHRDALVRRRALSVYAKLGAADATQVFRRGLEDQLWDVRVVALESLATAHRRGAIARPAVLQLAAPSLRARHWRERETAVQVVGELRHPSATAALASALQDSNGFVRQTAAVALGQTGGAAAAAALIAALRDEVPHVRAAACSSLARLRATGARPRVQPLSVQDPSTLVRKAAAEALPQLP